MRECRWIGCASTPRAQGLCQRHHARTLRAGRRASRGVDHAAVREAIRQGQIADTPVNDRLDDLAWLLDCGEWPDHAARRCGWTHEAAGKAARKAGRHDVAQMLLIDRLVAA